MRAPRRPDVSVIIPVRNRATYLADGIRSILDQLWDGSLEILCVDDGSETDPFAALPDPLPAEVRLFRKPHEGVGAARQYALERAEGRYIAFNDDDDLWLPNKLDKQVNILDRFAELDMLFSDLEVFTEAGPERGTFNNGCPEFSQLGPRRTIAEDRPSLYRYEREALLPMMLHYKVPMFLQSVVARRDFIIRIGGMDPRARSCGDCVDFCVRATHHGTIGYLEDPTFRLRRGHDHMTAAADWFDRELGEFFTIFPSYPMALQRSLRPWIVPRLIDKAWLHFRRGEYRQAVDAYRIAARNGRIGAKPRARWLLASLLGLFKRAADGSQPQALTRHGAPHQ